MLCGAKTRSGRPCRNDGTLFANGRCKLHGGLSTGPKSAEGKRKSAQNGWSPKRTP
ncbi:HGGxSTG domain-containing protein [Microbulbifer guangxiensis]|uniref:HGGxSTG domain-containing protein n=1 Tax=Microbulbifer guangxiensis TaxID=2904249 RepID=UPI0034E1B89F